MFPRRVRKGAAQKEIDAENFVYIDKEKTDKISKRFLKKVTHQDKKWSLKQMEGYSLMVFSVDNKFRVLTYKIIHHKYFEYLILIIIQISTIQLAIDNPLNDPEGSRE